MLAGFHQTIPDNDIPEGTMKGVTVEGESILIARVGGQLYAINDICSHFHTNLSNGELLTEQCMVQCPLHDSCFDLRTGEPLDPPAEDPVQTYSVKVEDGFICVGPR